MKNYWLTTSKTCFLFWPSFVWTFMNFTSSCLKGLVRLTVWWHLIIRKSDVGSALVLAKLHTKQSFKCGTHCESSKVGYGQLWPHTHLPVCDKPSMQFLTNFNTWLSLDVFPNSHSQFSTQVALCLDNTFLMIWSSPIRLEFVSLTLTIGILSLSRGYCIMQKKSALCICIHQ